MWNFPGVIRIRKMCASYPAAGPAIMVATLTLSGSSSLREHRGANKRFLFSIIGKYFWVWQWISNFMEDLGIYNSDDSSQNLLIIYPLMGQRREEVGYNLPHGPKTGSTYLPMLRVVIVLRELVLKLIYVYYYYYTSLL